MSSVYARLSAVGFPIALAATCASMVVAFRALTALREAADAEAEGQAALRAVVGDRIVTMIVDRVVSAPVTAPETAAVVAEASPSASPAIEPPSQPAAGSPEWLASFDRALEREFRRLDEREAAPVNDTDREIIARIKAKLVALDDVWARTDAAAVDQRMALQQEAQQLMGEIIQLGRLDRNQRLTAVAQDFGLAGNADVARFIAEVDRVFVETHLDWAALFNRGANQP